MAADITKTGTGGLRGLPGVNQRNDILDQIMSEDLNKYNPQNNRGIGIQAAQVGYGDSQYDEAVTSVNEFDNLNDVRYENQGWADVLVNSVGKMLGTAATTFMNSTIGVPVGLYTAAREHRWSGLWDNEFTQGMGDVDDYVEKSMTNYRSEYQQENPWWDLANLGSMTQIGDSLIKNAGFMLGAAAAGATGAGALGLMSRAMGFVNKVSKGTSFGVKLASSLLAATGEGMIEARQGVEERNKGLLQKLEDETNPEYELLAREQQEANALYDNMRGQNTVYNPETGEMEDPAYKEWKTRMDDIASRRQELDRRKKAATDEILLTGRQMGNRILLGNQILLSLGNFIQFGKAFAKSFDRARHVAQTVNKTAAPSLASAVRAGKDLADGWKIVNKNMGRLVAGTKGLVTEGSEEMNQQWLSSASGAYYNREDINDYWKARLEPESLKDVADGSYSLGQAISKGWEESWGDPRQWEQFVVGAITGAAGTVMPTKVFNPDKNKAWYNPAKYFSWEGGAYNEIKEYNDQLRNYEGNIKDLNDVVRQQDFASRFQRLGAHTALQKVKEYAALSGDKKLWKDADDKQTIHDIQAFVRAGKVEDLRSLYQELGADVSDAELDELIKNTSWEVTDQQDRENHDKEMDEQITEKKKELEKAQKKLRNVNTQIEKNKDNQQLAADLEERRKNIQDEIERHNKELEDLNVQKQSYVGKASKGGVFLTEDGNLESSREKIRETIKHNAEELTRKLDSYLESVAAVQEDTKGKMTKDQEDNLAYLHNLGKESQLRFVKTITSRRKDMPKKFMLKTNKTPEQLVNEYSTSDLTFEASSTDGYVEVDTSKMDDSSFADFFMREVIWGGNISPEFGETAEEKAQREKDANDKSISDEERKRRAMERFTAKIEAENKRMENDRKAQQATNINRMKAYFTEAYRKNNNATVEESINAWKELMKDLQDASDLREQAGQYRATLSEYRSNPQKVDEDKKKAEEKATKKENKEQVKGMSINDLTNRDDLDDLLKQAEKEKDIDLINKIRKAKILRNKRANIEATENDGSQYKGLEAAERDAAFEVLRRQVENDIADESTLDHEATMKELADQIADVDQSIIDDYIKNHTIVNIDPKTGKKTLALKSGETNSAEQAQVEQFEAEDPGEFEKQRDLLASKVRNTVSTIDLQLQKTLAKILDIDDIADDPHQAKAQQYTNTMNVDENFQDEQPEKKDDRNNPVQVVPIKAEPPAEKAPVDGIGDDVILSVEMQQNTTGGMQTPNDGGQHPWFSVSGRVGYHTNEAYSATLQKLIDDPNVGEEKKAQYRKQLARALAVEEFLDKEGAYTRVENGEAQRRGKVRFKIFKSVNEKAGDFVIFITDANGRVLADLPSSDADIDPNTERRTGLAALYEEARRQFEESGEDELELKGIESEIDNVYIGKPQYQNGRQSVSSLFGEGKEFTIALKVVDSNDETPVAFLDTGKKSLQGKLERDAIKDPLTGSLGQPYILIPTSQATARNNSKRGYIAVPIATPTFGELDQNSIFYRTVRQVLENIRDGKLSETEAKTKLGELFGLANFHVNFDTAESRKGAGIRATTYIRQDGSEKGAPHTLHVGDRASMDVDAILGELGRFFVNIANSRINSSGAYTTVDGVSYTYNQMIGQIATTNAARPHTVNDWFTIRPVEKNGNKWEMSKTPTQRIPYPSGSKNSTFNISVQYKDSTTRMWTVNPQDWTVRDEKGRAIYDNDSVHSKEEVSTAAVYMALAFGRYYMKDMSRPYVVQVGNTAKMFDPTTNTFKTAKELEETPKYRKGKSFNSLNDEYEYLVGLEEDDRIEGFEMAKAQKDAQQASQVSPQQVGQDMVSHLQEMGVDVELVDDATKAAEGLDDAQLLALGEQGARNLDLAEEATARMDNLSVANEMENAGKDALAIKLATGWERGADNKWRYEIPDLVLNAGLLHILINAEKPVTLAKLVRGYYNHKDENAETLFNAYNKIKNAKVIFSRAYQKTRRGSYDPDNNTIIIYPAAFGIFGRKFIDDDVRKSIEETLVHEIQHAIQEIEGFQSGTNLEEAEESLRDLRDSKMSEWNNLIKQLGNIKENYRKSDPTVKKYFEQESKSVFAGLGADVSEEELNALRNYYQNLINNDAKAQEIIKRLKLLQEQDRKISSNFDDFVYSLYYRAAGEAEARAISARHSMTDEERENTLLTDTIYNDVAKKDLRFLKTTSRALDAAPQSLSEEMQEIKAKAQADGTFMKAPNGNPTNLTERQWLQVRTKNFINWFGDWERFAPTSDSSKVEEQLALVFERIPELSKIGSIREYAAYLADKFPNSVDRSIYWHGTNEDLSEGFKSAKKGKGSGAPETQLRNDFYLAKQAWTVLQYVNGVNRNSVDKNGFAHWNKLWWELKEIMSNGRRENNDWKDIVIGEETVRQGIPNKKGVFNRDKGGENGKWLSERKADYGYENKSDKEFFEDVLGIQWGKDTFNTWTERNAEVFKALEKTQRGIYPAIINTQNPIREKGQNTYYEEQRGLFTQAEREGNDAILGEHTDNEFGSDVAVVLNASEKNIHFLGTKEDIEGFKKWLEENRASKVVDENGEPLVVIHSNGGVSDIALTLQKQPYRVVTTFNLDSRPDRYQRGAKYEDFDKLSPKLLSVLFSNAYLSFTKDYVTITQSANRLEEDRRFNLEHNLRELKKAINLGRDIHINAEDIHIYNPRNFRNNIVDVSDSDFGIATTFFTKKTEEGIKYSSYYGPVTGEFFLNIKNLKYYNKKEKDTEHFARGEWGTGNIFLDSLVEDGFDGAVAYTNTPRPEYVVFDPNQIKSATDNIGTFSNENPNINMLKVGGKILGFEYNGKLYLQKDAIDPNLPMHEYTHLWDRVVKEVDPRLWAKGKKLMQTDAKDLWKDIAESDDYGKRWQREGKTGEELEDLIASEVHARLVGEGFDTYVKKHPTGTFAQLKQWLLDAFKSLARTLGMSDEQINNLTLADFNNMTVRDFMEKSGPNALREKAENIKNSETLIEKIKSDSENYVLTDAKGNEDPNGAYYKDKRTGQLHARVTSIKEGDTRVQPFKETDDAGNINPWILPSTTIGNAVDEFVRAFFAGKDPETSPLAQNLSDGTKKHLKEELQKISDAARRGGWRIVSSGIVASGTILVKDANGDKIAVRVAGTLDLLLYNPEKNEYAIYDMKTHRSAVNSQNELNWAAQLSLYKQLLEVKFPELRGKIKGLKILPFSTSGYDALKQPYEKDSEGRLTSNGNIVKAEVKYDGKTVDLTGKEMNLDISFARPGFKKEYVEGEGAQKIIVAKPQPKTGEAPKAKVKEGLVKTIGKINAEDSVKDFIKSAFKNNNEALALAGKIDDARKDGSLGDLCLTEAEMNLLQDMLNERKINSRAALEATKGAGINVQEDELPKAEVAEGEQEKSLDELATEKGILNSSTKNAWNRLTDENKEKVVKLRRGLKNVKDELKNCQKLGKDPNTAISGYLHRKADETSGYTMIDMEKEMAWLDKVLPQLSKGDKVRIVEGLIKCSDGTWSYGQMKNNLIYLASRGKEGTVYHEAFHAITQWILTDKELDRLYEVAKARYGNLDIVTLEEKLADDFMLYTMGLEPSYRRRDLNIFKRLWQAIKNMFRNTSMIDKLYRDINDGIYADRVLRTENNVFSHIGEEDRRVSMKYSFLDKEQKKRLKDGGVNRRQYEVLNTDEKRYLFHCVL